MHTGPGISRYPSTYTRPIFSHPLFFLRIFAHGPISYIIYVLSDLVYWTNGLFIFSVSRNWVMYANEPHFHAHPTTEKYPLYV